MENNEKDDGYSEEEEEETCNDWESSMGYDRVAVNPTEYISVPLLVEYAESNHLFLRQAAAKMMLDVLQQAVSSVEAYSDSDEVDKVFSSITKLSSDEEPTVKCTLLNCLQRVASFCNEFDSPLISLKSLIVSDILVIVLKDIADEFKTKNSRVRKEAYSTLKYLQRENLVSQQNIEDTVCAIYQTLMADPCNVMNFIAAGNFIARMPPVVGEEATEKLLLPRISELCSHPQPRVREACVHYLIDLACFVNSMITENIIVPLFVKLSQDDQRYVMRACAETSVMLSCLCLMESRKTVLCLSFTDLLQVGFNVTPAAFKHLGPFITTFAQPAVTGLACDYNGDFVLVYSRDFEFPLRSRRTLFDFSEPEQDDAQYMIMLPKNIGGGSQNENTDEDSYNNNFRNRLYLGEFTSNNGDDRVTNQDDPFKGFNFVKYDNQPDLVQSCLQKVNADENKVKNANDTSPDSVLEIQDHFNSFQFWRDPIPEFDDEDLPTDKNVTKAEDTNLVFRARQRNNRRERNQTSYGHGIIEFGELPEPITRKRTSTPKQNIVPQILVDFFTFMPESFTLLTVDCAYTFPAVLLTLGSSNWPLLKDLYCKLALDSEKKVRKMVANNIHEIAAILGPDLATQELIPVYNSLLDDVEDVRITALNHLSCFIKLLKPQGRSLFLPHLMEFMMTDYSWNWRFRQQLSEQLIEMMDYFSPSDCWKYVSPVALTLLTDRVSAVRLQALSLVTHLIRNLAADITLLRGILAELAEQFAHSSHWSRRQSFAFLCSCLLKDPVLPDDMFARDVLPHLLDLSWDVIPNVRIAVARTLACDVIAYPYFSNIFSPHYDVLTQVLKRLCGDKDRDVRYYASLKTQPLPSLTHFEKTRQKSERW